MLSVIFSISTPYVRARVSAAAKLWRKRGDELVGIELAEAELSYPWVKPLQESPYERICLFPNMAIEYLSKRQIKRKLTQTLEEISPDSLAICGYGFYGRAALRWARRRGKVAVLMSESKYDDFPRSRVKEWAKSQLARQFDAALVGGKPQADYVGHLGMPQEQVFVGYDVVDNEYFELRAKRTRGETAQLRRKLNLPEYYFLVIARFVERKKNIPGLLQAYKLYRSRAESPWDLVICGSGPLQAEIFQLIAELGLTGAVHLPGFKQIDELPGYYGLASCFVLPSLTDQWGLVVNEAMASGLPVLVSKKCGCARDLVQGGVNGFTLDPYDVYGMAHLMARMSSAEIDLRAMGEASQRIIEPWSPELFAENLWKAVEAGRQRAASRSRWSWLNPFIWI